MAGEIYKRMTSIMAEIGAVKKDQKNAAQGFKFRGIDQFVNALHPLLVANKVFLAPKVVSERSEIKEVTRSSGKVGYDKHVMLMVEYTFWADDGSNVTIGPIAAEGLDSGDKATTKALSAGLKYALIQTFCVPTQDMVDSDSTSPTLGDAESEQGTVAKSATVAAIKPTETHTYAPATPATATTPVTRKFGTNGKSQTWDD